MSAPAIEATPQRLRLRLARALDHPLTIVGCLTMVVAALATVISG